MNLVVNDTINLMFVIVYQRTGTSLHEALRVTYQGTQGIHIYNVYVFRTLVTDLNIKSRSNKQIYRNYASIS